VYRVVLDPGVLIAALISPTGAPFHLVQAWLDGHFDLVVSPKLLAELNRVLLRPKFRRYSTEEQAEEYVDQFQRFATLVFDPEVISGLTPDPDDDYLVALARSAGSHFLVSGDAHLTQLIEPAPPVLTPRAFLNMLED
jgi:uncharacterized protein